MVTVMPWIYKHLFVRLIDILVYFKHLYVLSICIILLLLYVNVLYIMFFYQLNEDYHYYFIDISLI